MAVLAQQELGHGRANWVPVRAQRLALVDEGLELRRGPEGLAGTPAWIRDRWTVGMRSATKPT